jgi:hypothetical protein
VAWAGTGIFLPNRGLYGDWEGNFPLSEERGLSGGVRSAAALPRLTALGSPLAKRPIEGRTAVGCDFSQ